MTANIRGPGKKQKYISLDRDSIILSLKEDIKKEEKEYQRHITTSMLC